MSNKTELQANNVDLATILSTVQSLPIYEPPEGEYVWGKYTIVDNAKGEFITNVIANTIDKYPIDGMQSGYWYTRAFVSANPIAFTYTGSSTLIKKDNCYELKLLTSGVLNIISDSAAVHDVFLVGGGGGGIIGGATSAFGQTANSSNMAYNGLTATGSSGGGGGGYLSAGGAGGSDGGNGADAGPNAWNKGIIGIGTTTRAFGEPDGELYAGGGGGGGSRYSYAGGAGGAGGGGTGGDGSTGTGADATPNTGGGGGGAGGKNETSGSEGCSGAFVTTALNISCNLNTNYTITIGAGGGRSYGSSGDTGAGGSGIVILRGRYSS